MDVYAYATKAFTYDRETGVLTHNSLTNDDFAKPSMWYRHQRHFAGNEAGGIGGPKRCQYRRVKIKGASYPIHRLIWLMETKSWPKYIDHIDGNPLNNRWDNIREVTSSGNSRNRAISNINSSGVVGVSYYKDGKKWRANIGGSGNREYLGQFDTFGEAVSARMQAEKRLGYHANHGRKKA